MKREYACIQVADTGIGIREENKAKIFDRFYQEEHSSTDYIGSGIGMHIVKEYVTLHNGDIQIHAIIIPKVLSLNLCSPIRHECKNINPSRHHLKNHQKNTGRTEQETTPQVVHYLLWRTTKISDNSLLTA